MSKQRIEKTLIVLDEDEIRRALVLAESLDPTAVWEFMTRIIAKKVEAALRKRCG